MHTPHELTTFKIQQAVGSMAIEGIRLSAQTQSVMLSAEESQHFLAILDAPFLPNTRLQRALAHATTL